MGEIDSPLIIVKNNPPGFVAVLGQDVGSKGGIIFAVTFAFLVEDIGPIGEAAPVTGISDVIQQEGAELLWGVEVLDGFYQISCGGSWGVCGGAGWCLSVGWFGGSCGRWMDFCGGECWIFGLGASGFWGFRRLECVSEYCCWDLSFGWLIPAQAPKGGDDQERDNQESRFLAFI